MKRQNFSKVVTLLFVFSFLFTNVGFTQERLESKSLEGFNAEFPSHKNYEKGGEWLGWFDPPEEPGAVGIGEAAQWTSAIKFETEDIQNYDGWGIAKFEFLLNHVPNGAELKIWQGPDGDDLTEHVSMSLDDYLVEGDVIEVDVSPIHEIDASEVLYVGIEWSDAGAGSFPAVYDDEVNAPGKGDLLILGTYPGDWVNIGDAGIEEPGDWVKSIYVDEDAETSTIDFEIAELEVYPNPATDILNVESNEVINEINVLDITGRTVISKNVGNEQTIINIEELNQGMYLLQIETDMGMQSKKLQVK